ncbi:UNVERIFIED_CONTAM: hypothetical protein Sradi_3834500 [Sesamum radiatum]|uniref:Reverse transcriptase domain-containing protein n=1 Tax=Sesamum radiatum TaxID=300843 RepID=A0AAW2Q1J3_SESRA
MARPPHKGVGSIVLHPQEDDMEFAVKFEFKASNNEAKYEALVLGLRMAQNAGASHLIAYPKKKAYTYSKKYMMDVTDPTSGPGH